MKKPHRLPTANDWGVDLRAVTCPFCTSSDVTLESMTGGAPNELLMRCQQCRAFFYTLKDPAFLATHSAG